MNLWWRVVVFITIAQLYSTKLEIRFCAGSNSAHVTSCRFTIVRTHLRLSFIPEKHFITIINQSIRSLRFESMQFLYFVNSNYFLCHWKHLKFLIFPMQRSSFLTWNFGILFSETTTLLQRTFFFSKSTKVDQPFGMKYEKQIFFVSY